MRSIEATSDSCAGHVPPRELEPLAEGIDAASSAELPLNLLWRRLIHGHWKVAHAFFSLTRCYLILEDAQPPHQPISGRRLKILENILCGDGQKTVAIDLALAPSTIALNARQALSAIGVGGRPSRVHPLLVFAATASQTDVHAHGRFSTMELGAIAYSVVSVRRPDHELQDILPPAELDVIGGLVEGIAYTEIARKRGTSTRTIANQITSVFRRMRASGRNELLQRLFTRAHGTARTVPVSGPPPSAEHATLGDAVRRVG